MTLFRLSFQIFCDITYTVTSCTENEAQRYGRFLEAMLGIVMRWHKSNDVFEQECAGYPGFVTKFRVTTSDAQGDKDRYKINLRFHHFFT